MKETPFALPKICQLPAGYRLDMIDEQKICPDCGGKLQVKWTLCVSSISLCFGSPSIVLHIKGCSNCNYFNYPEEYKFVFPKSGHYSYDCMTEIGLLRLNNFQDKKIAEIISEKYSIAIPSSTISHLSNKFIDYFAASHYNFNSKKIKDFIISNGGYILHIDGTCEAGTPMSFSVIDAISGIVLATCKMNTENKRSIKKLLNKCLEKYGQPLAVVSDLSGVIKKAIKNSFIGEEIPHFICQFHFLENIGKKILKSEYSRLIKLVKKEKLKSQLRSLRKDLGVKNEDKLLNQKELIDLLENVESTVDSKKITQTRRTLAYTILKWILDYKVELNGEYFPFSLSDFELIMRCQRVFEFLKEILSSKKNRKSNYKFRTIRTIYEKLKIFFEKEDVIECLKQLANGIIIFNEVRSYLKMQSNLGKPVCRQNCEIENELIEEENVVSIDDFIKNITENYKEKPEFKVFINVVQNYFEKYKNSLSGHRILNNNNEYINVYRTNNVLEHFFGKYKRGLRKRVGSWNLKRQIALLHPDAMLVMNLQNEEYLKIIECENARDISKIFVECDSEAKEIKNKRKKKNSAPTHIPLKIIRNEKFIKNIAKILDKNMNILFKAR